MKTSRWAHRMSATLNSRCWRIAALVLSMQLMGDTSSPVLAYDPYRSLRKRAQEDAVEQRALAREQRDSIVEAQSRLQRSSELRRWVLARYDSTQRQRQDRQGATKRFEQAQRIHEQSKRQLLQGSATNQGAIKSGRALNFFLDLLGPTAQSHTLLVHEYKSAFNSQRSELQATIEELQTRIENGDSTAGLRENLSLAKEQLDTLTYFEQTFMGGNTRLAKVTVDSLRFQQGSVGNSLIIDNRDGVLPLDWPARLRENPAYTVHLERLRQAKELALGELRKSSGIQPPTLRSMLDNVDAIHYAFQADWMDFCEDRLGTRDAVRLNRFLEAKHFVAGLRSGVYRLVEARYIEDAQVDRFEGDSIIDLIDYASRHGLRFARADVNAEVAHQRVFEAMLDYYFALQTMSASVQYDEDRMAKLESRADHLEGISYSDSAQDLDKILRAGREPEWLSALKYGSELIKNGRDLVRELNK